MNGPPSASCLLRAYFCFASWCIFTLFAASAPAAPPSAPDRNTVAREFDTLPLRFEPNQGQSTSDAKYLAQGRGFSALFKENEADLLLADRNGIGELLRVTLPNASRNASVSAEGRLPGTVNYFNGKDPKNWHTGLPTYERLRYAGVNAGTDLIYYGSQGRLEFDFQLSPGADPSAIRMRFDGAQSVRLDRDGNLIVTGRGRAIRFQKPAIYQPREGNGKDWIAGSFKILAKNTIGFVLADYDHRRPLIIDPILNYSTYIGAPAHAASIAVDQNGEAYITGWTSTSFPTTQGSYQPVAVQSGYQDRMFVAKFNSTGTALLYATYLDGSAQDTAHGIALDANGDAFVVGTTSSPDFPITSGALQTTNNASTTTGFVTELNSTGTALVYSTYLGGSTSTTINQIALDTLGNAYLTGSTQDTNFPTTAGAYRTTAITKAAAGSSSAFVAKLNPTGTALVYATYLGGSQTDAGFAIAVDSAREAYVGGTTTSSDFPVTAGTIQAAKEASNQQAGFVTKLNASGTALVFSTYLSGKTLDYLNAVAVDSNGNVYATGSTNSPDFPVTTGAFQTNIGTTSFGPQGNAYVSEINPAGTALVYSTFLGGSISLAPGIGDAAYSIAVDGQGLAYVTGSACNSDFPTTSTAFEPINLAQEVSGQCTGFLTKLNPTPNTPLVYSTFVGGTGNTDPADFFTAESSSGLALDPSGNVYLTGTTLSVDFPTTLGVVETPLTGPSEEAFVTEFNASEMLPLPVPTVTLTSSTNPVLFNQPVTFTATVQSQTGNNTPTGYVAFNFFQLERSDADGTGRGYGPWAVAALDGSGIATFSTSSLEALQTPVNAFYLGDTVNAPATGTMIQQVTDIATVTTITANPTTAPYGTNVTFTVTVVDQNGNPLTNLNNWVSSGYGALGGYVPFNSSGQGTWSTSLLPLGTTSVFAKFLGFTGYEQSEGTVNVTMTPLGITPVPSFSPPAGIYTTAQQVNLIDSNASAIVYYTTDGSTPVPGASYGVYPTDPIPLPVSASQTINAIAVAPGYSPSSMTSAAYTIEPGFALSVEPNSLTLNSAQQGNVTVIVTPQSGFNSAVSFACSGLPTGASCAFSPATLTPTGVAVGTTLTVTAQTLSGALRMGTQPILPRMTLAVALCILGWKKRRGLRITLIVIAAFVGLGLMPACGGGGGSGEGNGGGSGGTTPVTSTVTVTATSGPLQQNTTVLLTVN